MIQDAIGFQWPAFAVAGIIAPILRLSYERKPIALTWASYVTLALAVGLYWFAIGVWIDKRLIEHKCPIHSKVVQIAITACLALTVFFFLILLGKDLLRGWPEGPQGAYGVTAWLALVSTILWIELNGFRRKAATAPKL